MERRSWLWRKKSSSTTTTSPSSDKISPADFSDGGSLGSLSERFSDHDHQHLHHQASYSSTATQSPFHDGGDDDLVTLKQRLSDALVSLRTKDDLVAQHAKVAEEAVSGWEKAEKEVVDLKQQLENVSKRNFELEDRVGQLDAALKECMRQLRLARDDQQQHLSVDHTQSLEKENSSLKQMLLSRAEELEIRIMERDLSSQAAEAASKQHLEAMKRVARLEAECRKHRKTNEADQSSPSSSGSSSASSVRRSRIMMLPCEEINLMDDFLEMERLAAVSCERSNISETLEARIAELEKKLEEEQCQVGMLQNQLKEINAEVSVLQAELARANESIRAGEEELEGVKAKKEDAEEEIRMLLSRLEKESAFAAENANKCVEMEKKIREMEHESELRREDELKRAVSFKEELKTKQERELGAAAARFAECQKTISNLGRQLKTLAAMEEELLVS
ncbi:Filament-like plant protein 3 [Linum grandiflorum]